MASIIAHENMNVYAYVSIIEAVLKLAIVFLLKKLPFDKLSVYGVLVFIVGFINTAMYRSYCKKHYEECRFKPQWINCCSKKFAVLQAGRCSVRLLRLQELRLLRF